MAINDVSLTAGMRSNLLSLQDTVNLLNRTQSRLSTGKKVNSAIDNPVSFFASQSLNSRASVIDSLKDAMGQAVQTITAADKGIKAITAMIEQAKGIAQSAQSATEGASSTLSTVGTHAFVAGTVNINVAALSSHVGAKATLEFDGLVEGDTVTLPGGNTFTYGTDAGEFDTVGELTALIDALADYVATDDGTTITISNADNTDLASTDIGGTVANLNLGDVAAVTGDTITFDGATYEAGVDFTDAATLLDLVDNVYANSSITAPNVITAAVTGTTVDVGDFSENGSITIGVGTPEDPATTFDVDGVTYTAVAGVPGLNQFQVGGTNAITATNLAAAITGQINVVSATANGTSVTVEMASDELQSLEDQYNNLLEQLTALAGDSGYKGKNLLAGAELNVQFEGAALTVVGFDASADGLDLVDADWTIGGAIDTDIGLLDDALVTLRQESSKMSGNLSIITVRQEFSTNMINTLTEGADKLTLADTNEEGANMLMLQTRQSLSTTALSLSAQAAQSVLRLFG